MTPVAERRSERIVETAPAKIEKGLPPIEADAAKVEEKPVEEPKKDDKKT
jgi:hypothetical protein